MHIDTSSMWLRTEKDYTSMIDLDKLVFDSKKIYLKMHPREAHLENVQLIDKISNEKTHQAVKEIYKDNYKIKGEEYFMIDGKYFGAYDAIILPIYYVKADVIFDNHKEHRGPMNGIINGIIRPVLDENNELKDIPPEFHFYLSMSDHVLAGHSVNDDNADKSILHVNMTTIDQNVFNRFKHIYMRKEPKVVPPWFTVRTYRNYDARKENFLRSIFVTTLEQ